MCVCVLVVLDTCGCVLVCVWARVCVRVGVECVHVLVVVVVVLCAHRGLPAVFLCKISIFLCCKLFFSSF